MIYALAYFVVGFVVGVISTLRLQHSVRILHGDDLIDLVIWIGLVTIIWPALVLAWFLFGGSEE